MPDATTSRQIRRALVRAERGAALDVSEAAALLAATGEELERLTVAAARVRDAGLVAAGRPGVVTFSPKVFIPVTKLCRDRCHYCTFVESPGELRRVGQSLKGGQSAPGLTAVGCECMSRLPGGLGMGSL